MIEPHTDTHKNITSFVSPLHFVHGYRIDGLVAAAQVAEGHSGVQHVEQGDLWKPARLNQQVSTSFTPSHLESILKSTNRGSPRGAVTPRPHGATMSSL